MDDRTTSENCERNNHCKVSSTASSITIVWDKNFVQEVVDPNKFKDYTIKFRVSGTDKFKIKDIPKEDNRLEINGLKFSTLYDINVYWCNGDGDIYNLFKKQCKTEESIGNFLMENAIVDKTWKPYLYSLKPVSTTEYQIKVPDKNKAENDDVVDRIRVLDMIAEYKPSVHAYEEKTLLLVGATGTGKSILVEALMNYIAGVSYDDEHRYTLISKTAVEKERADNLSQSQTSSVTVYRIPRMQGFMVTDGVNIIDTPGFNDTRKNFDKRITNQIKELFEKRVRHLDAVLIVVPLSTQRLTEGQQHVFSSILRLFGKDIRRNIFVAITWDDSGEAQCLSVLRDSNIPYANYFRFNNSNVLSKFNPTEGQESIAQTIWNNRTDNFSKLFQELENTPKTSVESSTEVINARNTLEIQLMSLEEECSKQAQVVANYKEDKKVLDAILKETPENREKCIYWRTEPGIEIKVNNKKSLNCPKCCKTCHKNCWVVHKKLNWTCISITKRKCVVCPENCDVDDHVLEKKIYVQGFVKKLVSGEYVVTRQKDREASFSILQKTLQDVELLIKELTSKALTTDDLTLVKYIQDLSNREQEDKKLNYEMRIKIQKKILEHLKKNKSIQKLSMNYLMS